MNNQLMPSAKQLEVLPTLTQSYTCDLKIDDSDYRVFLSRLDAGDGEPFDNTVYVEALGCLGNWVDLGYYDGDYPPSWSDFPGMIGDPFAIQKSEANELLENN
jgi:hypothetical protein